MKPYMPYLRTLRRIPDEAIRDMGLQPIEPSFGQTCLCGWALKEALANGLAPNEVELDTLSNPPIVSQLVGHYGGTQAEWNALYWGIVGLKGDTEDFFSTSTISARRARAVETAFAVRVAEACV